MTAYRAFRRLPGITTFRPARPDAARPMVAVQLLLQVLSLGGAYALVALGFVLILNATAAVNFSQGDLVAAGGVLDEHRDRGPVVVPGVRAHVDF